MDGWRNTTRACRVFFEGTHWTFPSASRPDQGGIRRLRRSGHAIRSTGAASPITTPTSASSGWAQGSSICINIKDKDGESYDGAKTYRLRVPPNVPVEQYWSLTAYDRETHALIKNVDRASRASNAAEVKKNPDGSVDLYIGPKAPAGQESNWIPTDPGAQVRVHVPPLRAKAGVLREEMGTAGCRDDRSRPGNEGTSVVARWNRHDSRRPIHQVGAWPLHLRRVPDLRYHRTLLRRLTLAERRTVHAEHHAVVGLPVDAVGRRRAGRRARHGRDRSHADAGRATIASVSGAPKLRRRSGSASSGCSASLPSVIPATSSSMRSGRASTTRRSLLGRTLGSSPRRSSSPCTSSEQSSHSARCAGGSTRFRPQHKKPDQR